MNFAMTGHKGLIGSFLLKKLIERGDKPVLLVDTREGKNILDIGNYNLKDKIDVFIHLASFCKINKIIENPLLTFENNSKGMERIMEFCRKNEIPKMVFTSSSRILSKEKNPYTASKIYGEELVKGYFQCYGIDYVIIRPSTVYGPEDDTDRLIPRWINLALKGDDLTIHIYKPICFFPIMLVFYSVANPYYFEALDDIEVWRMPPEKVAALLSAALTRISSKILYRPGTHESLRRAIMDVASSNTHASCSMRCRVPTYVSGRARMC